MLFTPTGTRTFNAVQSNGETRPIEYTIDVEGNAIIIAVDHIKVSDAPLPPQFAFIVQGWIAEHRASLSSHADFFGALAVGAGLFGMGFGLTHNQALIPHDAFAA